MCGIIGLFLKNQTLADRLGEMFAPMLECMSSRGPDSAGIAIYGDVAPDGFIKVTLRHETVGHDWSGLARDLGKRFGCEVSSETNANYTIMKVRAEEQPLRQAIAQLEPDALIMSMGRSIQILKEVGLPQSIVERFGVRKMTGSHVIGHTRMATESAVTADGSHPFSTGMDLCLVHNGSLSNHNRLRQKLIREGVEIRTENDSEVAAGYLTWRMRQHQSLQQSLESALKDLDGFYTFAIGTADGFAVLRDPIACKPAVMAETDDYVAMASEYQPLAHLPSIEDANIWEPKPGIVYNWERN